MLATARRVLADGGWLSIKVPCGPVQVLKETWRARLQHGYRATIADNLVHVSHFSPRSLRLALERAGFTEIAVEIAAPECPPGAAAATAARLALYNLGRSVPVRRPHTDRAAPAGVRARGRRAARPRMTPALSVVIPTFNNEAVLRRCIDSWRAPAAANAVELIVIEDGCRDGTRAFLEAESADRVGDRAPSLACTWTTRTSCGARTRALPPRARR